jgi:hypothetical protein
LKSASIVAPNSSFAEVLGAVRGMHAIYSGASHAAWDIDGRRAVSIATIRVPVCRPMM